MKKLKRLFINKAVRNFPCLAAAGAGFMAFSNQAQAQTVIINDNFTSGSADYSTPMNASTGPTGFPTYAGLAPSGPNLPSGVWTSISGYPFSGEISGGSFWAVNNFAYTGNNSEGITLGSFNTGSLQLSATFGYGSKNFGYFTPNSGNSTVVGFSSSLSDSAYGQPSDTTVFTGLQANNDGSLQEYVAGTAVGSAIAFVGTYNPAGATTLSYTIDTSTGALSNVSFGDSTATYNFGTSGSFLNADTGNVDIGSVNSGSTTHGASDFELSLFTDLNVQTAGAVPEPSTCALLSGGALALAALRMRRRTLTSSAGC